MVGQSFPFDAAADVMQLVDPERHRTPTGRDALRRALQRFGDLT